MAARFDGHSSKGERGLVMNERQNYVLRTIRMHTNIPALPHNIDQSVNEGSID